jgi:hypothetical protein
MANQRKRRKRRSSGYRQPGKRDSQPVEPQAPAPERPRARRNDDPNRPPAPWGTFPLVELVILLAIVMLGAGLFVKGTRGDVMLVAGVALAALGGTEVSIREHFAGYRSHTTLLAGVLTAILTTIAFLLVPSEWSRGIPFAFGAVVFAAAFYLLREAFKRRSGGLGFRGGLRP